MARIRSIHPGIFTDEAFMGLTVDCPLAIPLLLGLWTEADDAGSFEWKPLTLKARILPAATCDTLALLEVLVDANFIKRFEIDGRSIGVIRNFVKFQRPKAPLDAHPFTSESRAFAGFERDGKRPHSGTGRPPAKECSELVPNDFGTPTENPPQMKEEGCRRKEEVIQVLPSASLQGEPAATGAAALDEDPKTILFRDGVAWLCECEKKSEASARSAIGQMLKKAGGDAYAGLVLGVIRDAKRERKANPVAWCMGVLQDRSNRPRGSPHPSPPSSVAFQTSKPAANF